MRLVLFELVNFINIIKLFMSSPIIQAIKQICEEKNIKQEAVIETLEAALAAAFRKDFGVKNQNVKVEFNPETGESRVFDIKTVVADELAEKYEKEKEEREKRISEGEVLEERREERGRTQARIQYRIDGEGIVGRRRDGKPGVDRRRRNKPVRFRRPACRLCF